MRVLFLSLFLLPLLVSAAPVQAPITAAPVPAFNKVVWVWLENTSYQDMNLQKYVKHLWFDIGAGRFSNFKPVSKTTQGNAVAMISGTDLGVADNELTRLFDPSIVDLLESHNVTWKVYAEDFPGGCHLGAGVGDYKRYRVPFLSYDKIQRDRFLCAKVQGYANMEDDRLRNALPQLSILIPNLKSSGATSNALTADNALRLAIDPIVKSADELSMTTIIISTINMADQTKPAFAMILGNGVNTKGTSSAVPHNHYTFLRTIEDGLGLGNLNQNDASALPVGDIWNP